MKKNNDPNIDLKTQLKEINKDISDLRERKELKKEIKQSKLKRTLLRLGFNPKENEQ